MKDKEEEMSNVECPITNDEVKTAGQAPPYENGFLLSETGPTLRFVSQE